MKDEFCKRADKRCRTKEAAEEKAALATEYRRAYKCEFCDWWHLTSRERHEDVIEKEPEELDID